VKAGHKLRGQQSRQLNKAHGAIGDRFKWDDSKKSTKQLVKNENKLKMVSLT